MGSGPGIGIGVRESYLAARIGPRFRGGHANLNSLSELAKEKKMPEEFEKGDVVRLKSGGPEMTVQGTRPYGSDLICKWFEDGEKMSGSFAPESLERVEKDT